MSEYGRVRSLKEVVNTPVYKDRIPTLHTKSYKSHIETAVRGFVRAVLFNRHGMSADLFNCYEDIIKFVKSHKSCSLVKISKSSISHLKSLDSISRTVPRTVENEEFVAYVKKSFASFDPDSFFK